MVKRRASMYGARRNAPFPRRISIGKIQVDVPALLALQHTCDPSLCRGKQSCCQCYEITFSPKEMQTAIGLLPHCARYAQHLLAEDGQLDNPFDPIGHNLFSVDPQEDEACAFAFRDAKRRMWCSLHASALALGLSPWKNKPKWCTLWPLALSEGPSPVLTVDAEAFRFPCNRKRRRATVLDNGVVDCVRNVFGKRFAQRLQAALDAPKET